MAANPRHFQSLELQELQPQEDIDRPSLGIVPRQRELPSSQSCAVGGACAEVWWVFGIFGGIAGGGGTTELLNFCMLSIYCFTNYKTELNFSVQLYQKRDVF